MKKKLVVLGCIIAIIGIGAIVWISVVKGNNKKQQENEIVWNEGQTVNEPILLDGMKAITFEEENETPIELAEEERKEGIWYDYIEQTETTQEGGTSKWANAITADGSMWVWIPRYAYKIEWNQEQEEAGKIDVMFLKGTTNYNQEGIDVTTIGYTVHPAFVNGQKNNYSNGEWDQEITGMWVSKFEAGYAGQKNTASENMAVVNTKLLYERDSLNILGEIKNQETYMTYPVFIGKTYSYNNIQIGEMYELSHVLNQEGNPYGFKNTVDSHLMKNSEWGAVAYLAHSNYGRNGSKVAINNLDVSKAVYAATTVTGYTGDIVNAKVNAIEKIETPLQDSYQNQSYAWYTKEGRLGSTTGNQYGIYDMNGGASEYTAGYIETIDEERGNAYAKNLLENKTSSKYCTIYKSEEDEKKRSIITNYEANQDVYGDAIVETSKQGNGFTSWFEETSMYINDDVGFFLRGGEYNKVKYSGIFDFINHSGHSLGSYGFRCVLINN